MQRFVRLLGPGCLVAGLALLGYALHTGEAKLYLVVVVPVVSGSTPEFFLTTILLVVGVLLLPLAFAGFGGSPEDEEPTAAGPDAPATSGSSGGMLLVGPVPVFFGSWRTNPPISYRWAVVLGVVLAALVLLVLWGFSVL